VAGLAGQWPGVMAATIAAKSARTIAAFGSLNLLLLAAMPGGGPTVVASLSSAISTATVDAEGAAQVPRTIAARSEATVASGA